jgi:predicted nucleotidyltransferase
MDHGGRVRAAERFSQRAREAHPQQVQKVILFGSVARGDDHAESDVDVLIVWKGSHLDGLHRMSDLAVDQLVEEGDYVSVKVLTVEEFEQGRLGGHPFVEAVLAEGRALA